MAKEYLFCITPRLEFELDEAFEISDKKKSGKYLVSNVESENAEIYAPEVNFYFKNSKDEIRTKIKNLKRLYDVRSKLYDFSQDIDLSTEVGQEILLISKENQKNLREELGTYGFTPTLLNPFDITGVNGCIGRLKVSTTVEGKPEVLETDQILWFNAPQSVMGKTGIYDPEIFGKEKAVEQVRSNHGTYSYKNYIKYNYSICQYHNKRQEICGKCADICPTKGISKNGKLKQLEVSDIDCNGCGRCVSVCPSGALDYAPITRPSFNNICSLYKERIALIIPSSTGLEQLHIRLKENVLPLLLERINFLDECHFLSLLQTSGNPIILYTESVSEILENIIRIINEIFLKKSNKQAIFVCKDEPSLSEVFNIISPLQNIACEIDADEGRLKKREIFSARLSLMIGGIDIGVVKTGPHIHYGNLEINQNTCTLCLSCVEACSIGALKAYPKDNTLRFTPSICTSCGYCEITCPEQSCLHIVHDRLSLNSHYFQQKIMAHDEIFKCAECGMGFAPAKSIGKIADIMKPLFGNDATKIKTLYCCPDCKARVMLEAHGIGHPYK